MLFETLYKNLCERGKNLKEQWKPGSGLQRHRILPEHQGGIYVDSNCTYLTFREHAIAHYLLWRMNGNVGDRNAYQMMSGINPNNYPNRLGVPHTPETKKKISEGNKGKKLSEETKKKMSESRMGKKNPNYGRTGEKHPMYGITGDKHPMYGRKHTEESKEKMSEVKKGEKNSFYGRKHTEETLKKISEGKMGEKHPNAKKIKVTYLGIEKTYPYIKLASKDLDICPVILATQARGKYKTSRKYPGLKIEYV